MVRPAHSGVEVLALWLSYRDPRVLWHARLVAGCVVAYASSPIDLLWIFRRLG